MPFERPGSSHPPPRSISLKGSASGVPEFKSSGPIMSRRGNRLKWWSAERQKALQRPPETESEPETERKTDLVRLETTKGSARRKAREGEYKGSVRSLRTQQRAKNQRQ
ncbi:hypothetical protein ACIRD2_00005, partial [Streptomyces sp. NPDC093595]|uniref:hypothetical protein n=1 Tax=Streptomyces sp. NPDC093595 TaxID=3366045 RepID=UPI00382D00A5